MSVPNVSQLEARLARPAGVGWFFGTDRWRDGEFFRYELTGLNLVH